MVDKTEIRNVTIFKYWSKYFWNRFSVIVCVSYNYIHHFICKEEFKWLEECLHFLRYTSWSKDMPQDICGTTLPHWGQFVGLFALFSWYQNIWMCLFVSFVNPYNWFHLIQHHGFWTFFFRDSWSWSGSSATPSAATTTGATAGSSPRESTAGTSATRDSSATRAAASSLAT